MVGCTGTWASRSSPAPCCSAFGPRAADGSQLAYSRDWRGSQPVSFCSPGSAPWLTTAATRSGAAAPAFKIPTCPPPTWTRKATARAAHSSPVQRKLPAAAKFPASTSWSPKSAPVATKTSTTNGRALPTTSPASTISGTARVLNICRRSGGLSLRSGVEAATIQRCCTAG